MADRTPGAWTLSDEYLVVQVGGGAQMTAPTAELEWALRYGDPEAVRMVAAAAVESYRHLVTETSQESWQRIKLIRQAMREAQGDSTDG
jgi:hypothetical protein